MARVLVTRRLPDGGIDPLIAAGHEVVAREHDTPFTKDELCAAVGDVDAVLCLLTDRIDADVLDAGAGRLQVVSNVAVGYDNIDIAAAKARGIVVGNTPGVLTETTADLAFALILAAARRITEADRFVRDGRWQTWDPNLLLGYDLHGATIGIVGYGAIGRAVARRALGFGMRVLHASRSDARDANATRVPLDALLRESDVVSLHVPLTDETRAMIGEAQLRAMKPAAILVNTARGGIIDQPALVRALHEGWIAGAGLDVAVVEPIPRGDPLLDAPNCVLLPHIGSATHATRSLMASMAIENCLAGLRGEPLPNAVV